MCPLCLVGYAGGTRAGAVVAAPGVEVEVVVPVVEVAPGKALVKVAEATGGTTGTTAVGVGTVNTPPAPHNAVGTGELSALQAKGYEHPDTAVTALDVS